MITTHPNLNLHLVLRLKMNCQSEDMTFDGCLESSWLVYRMHLVRKSISTLDVLCKTPY